MKLKKLVFTCMLSTICMHSYSQISGSITPSSHFTYRDLIIRTDSIRASREIFPDSSSKLSIQGDTLALINYLFDQVILYGRKYGEADYILSYIDLDSLFNTAIYDSKETQSRFRRAIIRYKNGLKHWASPYDPKKPNKRWPQTFEDYE